MKAAGKFDLNLRMWLAYAAFHLGDYKKAMMVCDINVPMVLKLTMN